MIICSCSGVTDRDIRQAIAWMRTSEPYALVAPGKIYRALGKPAECGGCIRLFVERMRSDARMRHRSGGHAPAKPGDHDPIAEEAGHNSLPAFAS